MDVLSEQIAAGDTNTALRKPRTAGTAQRIGGKDLLSLITNSLDEDGASDIVSIDLEGKSSETDVMVIASGRSTRHVTAVSEKLCDRLKQEAGVIPRVEGKSTADWVLIDAGDVVVHIFRPEVREFYQLEKMWSVKPDDTAQPAGST